MAIRRTGEAFEGAHAEYVADQMKEPDYAAALAAVRALASAAPGPA